MSDRKAELERKKAKLAQIRAEKEARRKEREASDSLNATHAAVAGLRRDERQVSIRFTSILRCDVRQVSIRICTQV